MTVGYSGARNARPAMHSNDAPLGIFDSGVGGLTVFGRVVEKLPNESIVYLGDTARVPYGTKSADTVVRYARSCAALLLKRGVKMLIVACNTASAYALDALRSELPVPVIGVIEPGAERAVASTRNHCVGVIGTAGTISSGQYLKAIRAISPSTRVVQMPCPLLVPLAEEGWTDGEVPLQIAKTYLAGLLRDGIDTLVLGCTHYPLLKNVLARAAGPAITLVDSADATSDAVLAQLQSRHAQRASGNPPAYTFLVTDSPEMFARVGKGFLGDDIQGVEWVDIQ